MKDSGYHPRLARFLSPDPFIQAPDFSQSYNRYSYVWNNTMKYMYPGGYMVQMEFAHNHTGGGAPSAGYSPPTWPGYQGTYGFGGAVHWSVFAGNSSEYDHYQAVLYSGSGTYVFDQMYGAGAWMRAQKQYDNNARFWEALTDIVFDQGHGYNITQVEALGRTHFVGHFGALGKATIWQNGAISFANGTTGLDVILNALYGNAANGGGDPNLTNRVGGLDYVGYGVDGIGFAAEQTAKTTFKYGQRVNGVVKSAAQLTAENAAVWGKVATRLNVAGGVIGVVDCGMQSYDDFSNGNYGLGAYEATKAASYTTGTIMLFTPLAPIGAGIILVTGVVDIAGDIGMYIYGRNQ